MKTKIIFLLLTISITLNGFCFGTNNSENGNNNLKYFEFNPFSEYLAIFGDIQYYTDRFHWDYYKQSMDWIYEQLNKGMIIKSVLHTGDITQNNSPSSWQYYSFCGQFVSNLIPIITIIGDHDYNWDANGHILNRDSTHFNEFVNFPSTVQKTLDYFEEGKMENVVIENTIKDRRIDFLVLEFGPRKEVVEWACRYVETHPEVEFILMNHEYLEKGGGRRVTGLKCLSRLRNTTYSTPDELWEKLVKCHDNIISVLCGHVGGIYAISFDQNDFGRQVPQIMHNIQSPEFGYDYWLMLWEFPNNEDWVNVSIVNTQTLQYYENKPVLFRFSMGGNSNKPTFIKSKSAYGKNSNLLYYLSGQVYFKNSLLISQGKKYFAY